MKPLNIFIVGGGKVGRTLVEALVKEENDITLIDISEQRANSVAGQFDIMSVVGNGASYRVLVDAGIQEADVFIAVTASDELNLLCCSVASQVSNCKTIARVRTPDYSAEVWYLRDKLGLSMVINPELESANEITRILSYPAALEVNTFLGGEAQMIQFKIAEDSQLIGRMLPDLIRSLNVSLLFTAVERNGETFIPNGLYQFQAGDTISFVTSRRDAIESLKALGLYKSPIKNCLLIGGGRGGFYLATALIRAGIDVKIIEKDYNRCEELSAALPKATIINGNGASEEILREEGIEFYDAVIPYTGMDEVNIMLALHAKKFTKAKLITKISTSWFNSLISDMDLGSIIYPTKITGDSILAYTRARRNAADGEMGSLYHTFNNKVEAMTFAIKRTSEVTDKPLMDLALKDNVLIALLFRKGKIMFPKGSDSIQVGDSVMVVTTNFGFTSILDILR